MCRAMLRLGLRLARCGCQLGTDSRPPAWVGVGWCVSPVRYSELALVIAVMFMAGLVAALPSQAASDQVDGPKFVRLIPLPPPRLAASARAYPGGGFEARNLIDGVLRTEYASDSQGTNTFVELDFGRPTTIAGFKHVDRNDPATVAESELVFSDAASQPVATVAVVHTNTRAGTTWVALPAPVTAQRVRWRVTKLGPAGYRTVGGAEVGFFCPGQPEPWPRGVTIQTRLLRMLERKEADLVQPLELTLDYPYATPVMATVRVSRLAPQPVALSLGLHRLQLSLPKTDQTEELAIVVEALGQTLTSQRLIRAPVRPLDIYVLPHSHVDIGYTALQTEVEKKQNDNIDRALELIRATADYPVGARFKWNVEVLWPVDNYLRTAQPEKRQAFLAAVKTGHIGLDALYGNLLTGLCRPEELLRSVRYALQLSALTGVQIDSAMISDVPGYTWSLVSALSHAGIRYLSFAPNYFDRMGRTMVTWQNRPFWWRGPDGRSRLLCWCPSRGYALGHLLGPGDALVRFIPDYLTELETNGYPYDLTYLRWSVYGDNGAPDDKLADVVRDWNMRYACPRLVIATTAEPFREFERRYGAGLPEFAGSYTPYWEDGAGSSAFETALNRGSAERLLQAETLFALAAPKNFPAAAFAEAWRNVLLYSEHTWGAHNSVSQPDAPFVLEQWRVKQGFAQEADRQSRQLLDQALRQRSLSNPAPSSSESELWLEVINTTCWPRTELVTVPADWERPGDRVLDSQGRLVPSQPLANGALGFVARGVPPFGSARFRLVAGTPPAIGSVRAQDNCLVHPDFTVRLNPNSGAIASWFSHRLNTELVDARAPTGLNDYFYLQGSDLQALQRNGPPRITVQEPGPLVASLRIESDAPGCRRLVRVVRVVDGVDRLELINTVDKAPVRQKEGVHFGFGFYVPKGVVRLDEGWAVVRPEQDQIPAACKNWFSVQHWVDIANDRWGVTWAPVDAPLVQVGQITARLIGSQADPNAWIEHLPPSQTLYSWVMNNHWHTNYRAEQQGPTVFRYFIRPHKRFVPEAAARFGLECAQPLLVRRAGPEPPQQPRLKLSSDRVIVTAFKPSDDGKGWIVRLFGAGGKSERVRLSWSAPRPRRLWLSDTTEAALTPIGPTIQVPAWGIVTLRAEL
jgi:alpha-mannosidase